MDVKARLIGQRVLFENPVKAGAVVAAQEDVMVSKLRVNSVHSQ